MKYVQNILGQPWENLMGKKPNYITSLELLSEDMENLNKRLQARYRTIRKRRSQV
jgi:hypothetical protein